MNLNILSGGAAHGLVRKIQPEFEAAHGCRIQGTFGAVGMMKDRLLAGAPCDLLILTGPLIAELAAQGHVVGATARPLGLVKTGVAVPQGQPDVDCSSAQALRATLLRAGGVYMPDPAKATAGIHFMKVLQALGVAEPLASRLRTFPNGATAMGALAGAAEVGAVGCTQVTEILDTPGVRLCGLLPPPYELATTYTAAVCNRAAELALAVKFIAALASAQAAQARRDCGFEPVS